MSSTCIFQERCKTHRHGKASSPAVGERNTPDKKARGSAVERRKYRLIVVNRDDARQDKAFDKQILSYLMENNAQVYEVETAEGPDIAQAALLGYAFLDDFVKTDLACVFYDIANDNATFLSW